MDEKNIQSVFGVDVFEFESSQIVDDGKVGFNDVKFLFPSLEKWNGLSVSVDFEWEKIAVWSDDGEEIGAIKLLEVPEFQVKLLGQTMNCEVEKLDPKSFTGWNPLSYETRDIRKGTHFLIPKCTVDEAKVLIEKNYINEVDWTKKKLIWYGWDDLVSFSGNSSNNSNYVESTYHSFEHNLLNGRPSGVIVVIMLPDERSIEELCFDDLRLLILENTLDLR